MTEGQIATKLKNELNKHGWFFKTTGVRQAGVPDIVGCYEGKFIGIEVKIAPNKITPLQKYNLEKIKYGFGLCYYPKDKFYTVMHPYSTCPFKTIKECTQWIFFVTNQCA